MNDRKGMRILFTAAAGLLCALMQVLPAAAEPEETTAAETTIAPVETMTATTEPETTTTTTITTPDPVTVLEYETLADGTLRLTRFRWSCERSVTLPDAIGGKQITEIGDEAFRYCYADEIILPKSLKKIGYAAFMGDVYLQKITIPQGCTEIDASAFANCKALAAIELPQTVTFIGKDALAGTAFIEQKSGDCIVLGSGILYAYKGSAAELTVPDTVKIIGENACAGHEEMTALTIPSSVTAICKNAFAGCAALRTVRALGTLTSVAEGAFADTAWYDRAQKENFLMLGGCLLHYGGSETAVKVSDSVHAIGDAAFAGNTAITTLELPNTVAAVGDRACSGCSSLQVVMLGDAVRHIGASAFEDCTTLRYLQLGHALETIGDHAFAGCKALSEVYLPNTVTAIGTQAFGYRYTAEIDIYHRMDTALTLYANCEAGKAYAAEAGISNAPLPDAGNTETAPEVTTKLSSTAQSVGSPRGKAWIPALLLGTVLVVFGGITAIFRIRKRK